MPMPDKRGPSASWIGGVVRLVIAAALAAPVLFYLGSRRWPFAIGAFVLALLALGALERRWQARPLPRRYRPADRRRFRVFDGGKGKGKGNGHAHDVPEEGEDPEESGDKPRWLM